MLHNRPYTDSKILVNFFCEKSGVISGVSRLAKNRVRSPSARQFVPLFVQWYGAGELKTIKSIEQVGQGVLLAGESLYCGLYLNELLLKLVPKEEPHPRLYAVYALTLQDLVGRGATEETLRLFELTLLDDLGYGFDFGSDINGDAIAENACYSFVPERGFSIESGGHPCSSARFSGRTLSAIKALDFSAPETRVSAKKLCRQQINHLLGDKPLKSRELFIQAKSSD